MVMDLIFETVVSIIKDKEERGQCDKYLTGYIDNMSVQMNSGKKRLIFSAHTVNVSLSILLRNKNSYDDLRESGMLCLPHPSILKNRKRYEGDSQW